VPHVVSVVLLAADLRSALSILRVKSRMGPPLDDVPNVDGGAVPLRLRALRPATTYVRPRTSDSSVVAESLLSGYCLPPEEIAGQSLRQIVELGSNIGLGLATLASRYPAAELLGVEADAENHALAVANTEAWRDRCEVVHTAVWDADGRLVVQRDGNLASGYTVRLAQDGEAGMVDAVTIDKLFEGRVDMPIDYLYLDIEGAHHRLLRDRPSWLERVQAIKVSAHIDTGFYDETACARDLEVAGFVTREIRTDTTGWTIGVRPALAG
jgi:FkbM family methyltransferase